MSAEREVTITLADAPLAGATGRGVVVAVVDSGIAAGHPHVGSVQGGCWLAPDGESAEWGDRIGHGTAVAAAIREKAPDVELLAVRVFANRLATNASTLVRGIEWAAEHGARLVNLSLGTTNDAHEATLARAVRRAMERGTLVVAAAPDGARRWLPGALPGVIAVAGDPELSRAALRIVGEPLGRRLACSPYPRPIDGVPVDRNLAGTSFAVANATGILARFLSRAPSVDGGATLLDALCAAHADRAPDETAIRG